MNTSVKNILIPLDLMRSPCDALVAARNMAGEVPVSVTLLYVLNLNIVAAIGRQVYDELCAESETALRKLAGFFFGAEKAARIVVRVGRPHEQILAEAKAAHSDLIILSGPERKGWKQILRASTAQKIVDASPCATLVLPRQPKAIGSKARIPAPAPIRANVPAEVLLPAA